MKILCYLQWTKAVATGKTKTAPHAALFRDGDQEACYLVGSGAESYRRESRIQPP